ncbi:restriction endonuclease subunit S [Clostridium perfringens]|uniref:restriction endonuclease subunit S n=1 Tax=Clostridium perfringens TaxID=1502 RepID=UPI0018E4202C|nr:restriction endonuclease subunit S [Clostridium perfringens]MBI6101521.1 restriction endonuclease subunit S [Clostridium perfringens]MDJ8955551.1 restriction endonuclease subunit S [Clostridium perfringens]MDK0545560.1 restriction endonuclease subunit S [Clostridium perfringens]MDK0972679.1 restriction endonuclease subunit S [Clostridium perfringens]MDM0896812.1 restriction endonuclease subunit S [Clostridium perfringens]
MSRNVPKLRFKGFDDEWEKEVLGDLIVEKIEKTEDKGKYPLYSLTIESGVVPKSDRYEREFLVKKEGNFKIVNNNDFVYNPMNLRFGALAIYKGDFPVSVSGYYNVFSFKNRGLEKFWDNYLKTDRMMYLYNTIATGSLEEKKRVHYSQFKELKLPMPSLQEQEKIANFLSKVDSIIEKQEKKVQYWNSYKKGMMQKIFSQKIRFKDENGRDYPEWEEKKLGEITNILKGQQLNKENFISGGKYYVLNGGVNPSGYTNEYNVEGESISISEGGNSCGFVNYNKEKFWSGGHCYTLKLKGDEIHNVYLFEVLKYKEIYIMSLRIGTGLPNIQKLTLSKFKIDIPCLEEQIKIANFLSNIDNIIEKESKKLEKLKQWKKGLLQQMFV